MNRIPAASIVVAVALIGVGCGGPDPREFARDLEEAQKPLELLSGDKTRDAGDQEEADRFAAALDDAAARMRRLDAPDQAKAEFDAFLKEVDAGADAFRAMSTAVASRNDAAFDAATAQAEKRVRALIETGQALETIVRDSSD
jgi:hypothetical protein